MYFMQAATGSTSGSAQQEEVQHVAVLNKRISALEREKQHLQSEVSRLTAFTAALQSSTVSATAAAVVANPEVAVAQKGQPADKPGPQEQTQSGRRPGLTPLKSGGHRLAGTLKSMASVGMPDTPTDAAGGAAGRGGGPSRGPARRGFSSDGGGSVVSTPGATLTGGSRLAQPGRLSEARSSSRGGQQLESGQAESGAEALGQESDGVSAPGGVSYAPQHWEEVKRLQGKIDALRWGMFLST